ncbi:flagellar protein FlhE [Collimonas silvisoli]|uniref:flagellar protein FlhE n=1 Tax=Collimonas silvisoli TaxID=2825884 RepID=UPI001B8CB599|nr:flagellar protein FlhE [Collimonas silvisoli]
MRAFAYRCREFKLRYAIVASLLLTLAVLPAASVFAGDQPAAAISLSTYLGRNGNAGNAPAGPGAIQLNSNATPSRPGRVTGSWSAATSAPAIFHRGVNYQSPQIAPAGSGVTSSSKTRRVSWQYSFLTAPPAGVHAYLCNYARCVGLSSASGNTDAFDDDNGWSNFVFAFVIDGRGALTPALQGSGSQVIVSYE